MNEYEKIARDIADSLGRDWEDCGAYERQSYKDEAARRIDGLKPRNLDEMPDCVWRHADTPFADNH